MRHSGWRRLRGDTDRPDLLDLGKKLLGYLDNQRWLSGVKTLTIQREAPDGSIVRARWVGDQPQIDIAVARPQDRRRRQFKGLRGIVVKPRNKGTSGSSSDGFNAFGVYAHALVSLAVKEGNLQVQVRYFDETTAPGTVSDPQFYSQTHDGNALFTAGLASGSNNDWTDGVSTITWTLWSSAGTEGPKRDYSSISGYYIFHNGRLLVDVSSLLGLFDDVVAACLRRFDGTDYLVFVLSDGWRRLRAYRIPIKPDTEGTDGNLGWVARLELENPRLAPLWVLNGVAEQIADFSFSPTADHDDFDAYGAASFNRSATEFRTLRHVDTFHPDFPGDGSRMVREVYEIIGDFSDLGAVSFTQSQVAKHGWKVDIAQDYSKLYSCWANDYALTGYTPDLPKDGNGDVIDGTYDQDNVYTWNPYDWSFGNKTITFGEGSVTHTFTPYGTGPIPLVVQYEGDTPVYLYYEPGPRTVSSTINRTLKDTIAISGGRRTTWSGGVMTDEWKWIDESYDGGWTHEASGSEAWDGTFFAIDAAGNRWWEETISFSRVDAETGTMLATMQHAADELAGTSSESGVVDGDVDTTATYDERKLALWFVDLRTRSIISTTEVWHQEGTKTYRADSTHIFSGGEQNVTLTRQDVTDNRYDYQTRVYFYGALIDSQVGHVIPAQSVFDHPTRFTSWQTPRPAFTWAEVGRSGAAPAAPMHTFVDPNSPVNVNDEADATIPKDASSPFDVELHTVARDLGTTSSGCEKLEDNFRHGQGAPFNGQGNHFVPTVDHEPQPWPTVLANADGEWHRYCQAVAHDGAWAYSMPDVSLLQGAVVSTQWVAKCGHRDVPGALDLRTLIEYPTAELFATMWPLSICAIGATDL